MYGKYCVASPRRFHPSNGALLTDIRYKETKNSATDNEIQTAKDKRDVFATSINLPYVSYSGPVGATVTVPAELARVFGESRRPREGRVYRLRFVSGELTTNLLGKPVGVFCPSRLLIDLSPLPFVHSPFHFARISRSGVVATERDEINEKIDDLRREKRSSAKEDTRMMERTWRSIRKSTLILLLPLLLARVNCEAPLVDSSALPLEHRSVYGPPAQYGPPATHGAEENWPLASPDTPQIKHLQVQCEKTHMRVNIEFDRPFYGMIFSKGFYSDPHCVHLKPGTGHLSATFEIFLNSCGMSSSANHNAAAYGAPTPSGSYVENTIIVQYDPYVQEVWDQARKLRCTWYDFYEKAVTFRPFQVDMLHAVTANFLGDNLQCWMQIQVGKGPWASEVSGIVKIGQTMTMVLAIKDDENKFDMLVRNCVAHDGKRAPIQLVDQYGCVVRPKIMSRFQKIKNFGPSASVVSFAYFQAFKFPDSMNVHFQCVIQVCRYNCPEPKCGHPGLEYGAPATGLTQEYGAPVHQNLAAEYGAPPVPEYGVPPAFADPRHPSGPAGAYSEQNADVVPAPQAQTSSSSPSSTPGDATASSSPQSPQDNIHLPPPPLPGHPAGAYQTVKRKGTAGSEELEGNLATLGGRPRSVEGFPAELRGARRRRSADEHLHDDDSSIYRTVTLVSSHVYKRAAQEMTDVNTSRTIQVVAPGDVNFALGTTNSSNDTTVVIQNASASADPETICMSLPGFVGGLVMLLLVVVVASLVAAFLFVRVRAVDRKNIVAGSGFVHAAYAADNCSVPNPEFVKVAN